jgi:soluble lytic murein transglycosylase-like protein
VAPLKLAFAAAALAFATPCAATRAAAWRPFVAEASLRFGVPIAWIERVMRVESGGQTTLAGSPMRSRGGAMGLMQLMPGTWKMMRAALALGSNPDDPHDNVLAGVLLSQDDVRPLRLPRNVRGLQCGAGAVRCPSDNR